MAYERSSIHLIIWKLIKKWWSQLLGFDPYFDQPFYVGFDVGGPRTYFVVESVEQAVEAFVQQGCTVHGTPMEAGDGIFVATVKRPNGQLVGLIYNPHFKQI